MDVANDTATQCMKTFKTFLQSSCLICGAGSDLSAAACGFVNYLFLGECNQSSQQKACKLDSVEKCQALLVLDK